MCLLTTARPSAQLQHMTVTSILCSKKQAASLLGVSVRSIDYLIASGELPTRRIGRRVLIPVAAIEKFAKQDHPAPLTNKSQEQAETV
jgi:excisionase family DNA binding protein